MIIEKEKLIADLIELINIPSVCEEKTEQGCPFGTKIKMGFDWVKGKAEAFGFSVTDFDGYALQIDAGTGKRVIGILCHADVVPAGEGWDTDPFDAQIRDGKIYGRGAVDDKGPLICALYAVKHIVDDGLLPEDTRIRIIVGGDEEGSWRCIEHYCRHADCPEISFAADGMFPLVYGEKGLIDFDLNGEVVDFPRAKLKVVSLIGGSARNSVPGFAEARIAAKEDRDAFVRAFRETAEKENIRAEIFTEDGFIILKVKGTSAHAMFPERGENAVSLCMKLLAAVGRDINLYSFVDFYRNYIGEDYTGGLFGCKCSDEESGALTLNVGKIVLRDEKIHMELGIRYPISANSEKFYRCIDSVAKAGDCEAEIIDHLAPIYFKREDKVVKLLEEAYREVTEDQISQPFTVGAASYARAMKNTVAFGPIFPGQKEMSHLPNEFISIEDLVKVTEIYITALRKLIEG